MCLCNSMENVSMNRVVVFIRGHNGMANEEPTLFVSPFPIVHDCQILLLSLHCSYMYVCVKITVSMKITLTKSNTITKLYNFHHIDRNCISFLVSIFSPLTCSFLIVILSLLSQTVVILISCLSYYFSPAIPDSCH